MSRSTAAWAILASALWLACGSESEPAQPGEPASEAAAASEEAPAEAAPSSAAFGPSRELDLCARFSAEELGGFAGTTLDPGKGEYYDGPPDQPGTSLCTWMSAPKQPYAIVKVRFSGRASAPQPPNAYAVADLGDAAWVDRAFASTTVVVGEHAFTVQVTGVRQPNEAVAAAHPDLSPSGEGPASVEEMQASLGAALALEDRLVAMR
jgi:hypothetical protein